MKIAGIFVWVVLVGALSSFAEEANPALQNRNPIPTPSLLGKEKLSPAAVGWGNLLVPGLGATLEDRPVLGLTEAALEIGSFYGGTLLATEARFEIDGSTVVPAQGGVGRAVAAQMFQQFGLKYHFYNTFYHYQQAVIASEDSAREKNNPQPIYRGTWKDMLVAPFQWDNLKSVWTWPVVVAASAFLIYDYATTDVSRRSNLSRTDQNLYGVSQIGVIPFGSSFGEDPLFRGFIQREIYGMTGSLFLAVVSQSTLFALLHDDHVSAFVVGSYFGIEADQLHGNLGPMMAAHFWINVVSGVVDYFAIRRALGQNVPLNPPLVAQVQFPIF